VVLEHLASKVATTLSMQTLQKAFETYKQRLQSLAHVWDKVLDPTKAMQRTLANVRQELKADVVTLYQGTQVADSSVMMLRGVAGKGEVVMPEQVPQKGIIGTVMLDAEPIIASRDSQWGWDCPQFNAQIDIPMGSSDTSQIMALPLKSPGPSVVPMGVISFLRGHDTSGGTLDRFTEDERSKVSSTLGLLVQLLTWAGTENRHHRSHAQRRRLMDVITLIADTQQGQSQSSGSAIPTSPTSPSTTKEAKKVLRLDELLGLARVSLAAQVAVLHMMVDGLLQIQLISFRKESSDKSEEGRSLDTPLPEINMGGMTENEFEVFVYEERQRRRCSMGQGLIGYCALTLETINTELARAAVVVPVETGLTTQQQTAESSRPGTTATSRSASMRPGTAPSSPQSGAATTSSYPTDAPEMPALGRLRDPENRLDIGVDIPPGIEANPMAVSCIPIVNKDGTCAGVLQVLNKESPFKGSVARFTDSDITIMRILSTAFAAAVQHTSKDSITMS